MKDHFSSDIVQILNKLGYFTSMKHDVMMGYYETYRLDFGKNLIGVIKPSSDGLWGYELMERQNLETFEGPKESTFNLYRADSNTPQQIVDLARKSLSYTLIDNHDKFYIKDNINDYMLSPLSTDEWLQKSKEQIMEETNRKKQEYEKTIQDEIKKFKGGENLISSITNLDIYKLEQILKGYQHGLNTPMISNYAEGYTPNQMEQLREGWEYKVNVLQYSNPDLTPKMMRDIKDSLMEKEKTLIQGATTYDQVLAAKDLTRKYGFEKENISVDSQHNFILYNDCVVAQIQKVEPGTNKVTYVFDQGERIKDMNIDIYEKYMTESEVDIEQPFL